MIVESMTMKCSLETQGSPTPPPPLNQRELKTGLQACSCTERESSNRMACSFPSHMSMVGKGTSITMSAALPTHIRSCVALELKVEQLRPVSSRTAHKTCWLSINTFRHTWDHVINQVWLPNRQFYPNPNYPRPTTHKQQAYRLT